MTGELLKHARSSKSSNFELIYHDCEHDLKICK